MTCIFYRLHLPYNTLSLIKKKGNSANIWWKILRRFQSRRRIFISWSHLWVGTSSVLGSLPLLIHDFKFSSSTNTSPYASSYSRSYSSTYKSSYPRFYSSSCSSTYHEKLFSFFTNSIYFCIIDFTFVLVLDQVFLFSHHVRFPKNKFYTSQNISWENKNSLPKRYAKNISILPAEFWPKTLLFHL